MKKRILVAIVVLALMISVLPSCSDMHEDSANDVTTRQYSAEDTWAIYWYLCGSDLESDGGFATEDLDEMLQVTLPENVQIVVQTGGSYEWWNDVVDADAVNRFLYSGDELTLVDEQPNANMGDSETFADFLQFCNTEYPADHQVVLLWNHGGGSLAGVAFDEQFDGDSLSLAEMHQAFDSVFTLSESNPPIEMIGFDACLMATLETAQTFSGVARYMVASEELEPGCGWDYSGFLQALADDASQTGATLGMAICDTYATACEELGLADEITLSVIDLTALTPLLAAYHNVGVEALNTACNSPEFLSRLRRGAEFSENYGPNNKSEGYTNMVDLSDFAYYIADYLPNTTGMVDAALEQCVVYKVNGPYRARSGGLACYYPYDTDTDSLRSYSEVISDNPQKHLYSYLVTGRLTQEGAQYAQSMQYIDIPGFDLSPLRPLEFPEENLPAVPRIDSYIEYLEDFPVYVDNDGNAVLEPGPELAEILSGVYFELAYVSEEDDLILLLGRDNDIDADWENGIFRDNFRGMWGALDGNIVYMELTYEGDDYNLYSVPILLNGEECSLRVAYDYDTEMYYILGARRGLEDNGMADKNLITLQPGDEITTLHYAFSLSEDEEAEQVEVDTFIVTEYTSFGEIDMGDGSFVLLFEMADAQNNSAYAVPVFITVEGGIIYAETE